MEQFDWGSELPTLHGRRVNLRWLTQDDAPEVFAVFGDPEVVRFWSSPPFPDVAAAVALIDQVQDLFKTRRLYQWGICSPETGKVLGTCTLFNVNAAHRRAEIGFAVARANWGTGLGAEAVALLIGFAFATLDLHRLEADVDPQNARSLRLLERQGFQREGYLRERWHLPGKVYDAVYLGLLAHEWKRA